MGLQLKRNVKVSNTNKIQQFQSIEVRKITNGPSSVSNYTLYKYLLFKTVYTRFYKHFHTRLQIHQNPLIKNLSTQPNLNLATPGVA